MVSDESEVEIDPFLDSEDSIEDLMEKEYGPTEGPWDTELPSYALPEDESVVVDKEDASISPDGELIKGTAVAFTDIDSDELLDSDLSKEEEIVSKYSPGDQFSDPALNAVYKSTVQARGRRMREQVSKRELLDLAADIVDEYFRKRVDEDGLDDSTLNKLKFSARKRVVSHLLSDDSIDVQE